MVEVRKEGLTNFIISSGEWNHKYNYGKDDIDKKKNAESGVNRYPIVWIHSQI